MSLALSISRCATRLPLRQKCSYTTGMKTAVSIPEDVFKGAERLARKTKRSRSRLFSDDPRSQATPESAELRTATANRFGPNSSRPTGSFRQGQNGKI